MIAYHTEEIEVEIERDPIARLDGLGPYEYRLYTVDAEVVVNAEWCELRSVTGASLQLESGEERTIGVNELPAMAEAILRERLSDDDIRAHIYRIACEVDADMEADLQRRIANEQRHEEENGR